MSYGEILELSKLDDLLPKIVGKLPGCPPVAIQNQLEDTAEDFCRTTGCLKMKVGDFDFKYLDDGNTVNKDYLIEIPILARVNVVERVFYNREILHPSCYHVSSIGECNSFIHFHVIPAKAETAKWGADVSLVPLAGCREYPCEFLQNWRHAIISGVLAELMSDSTKRWYNQSGASLYSTKYHEAKQDAVLRRLSDGCLNRQLSFRNDEPYNGNFF